HRILPPENNNNNSLNKIVLNQTSLHDFINKRILLPLSKQNKITSHVLAWIVDDLQPFNAITNNCFQNMILECEPRFEFPCYDKLKEKLMQSISPEFSLYQALLTIQKFDYPHTALIDNASSMIKAIDQLGIEHIGSVATKIRFLHVILSCTAHRIQLALEDGFGIAEVDNLINKARILNSHISGKDKYHEQLHRLQAELDPQHLINSLSSDTRSCWSSTYNLLKNLLFLCNAIICLADNLQQSVNRQERQDGMKILELMLSVDE
ncbi:2734_t:CDS:2, partial [Cetraspora pellucida]